MPSRLTSRSGASKSTKGKLTCLRGKQWRGGVHLCSRLPTPRSATRPSIVGAQPPAANVVCAGARMSTNFGCGSRARACSGYVRASLAWFYLQSTLFNQIHVLQRKKDYTPPRRVIPKRTVGAWAPTLAAQICLAGAHARGRPPGESPFLHDHRIGSRPFLPHGRHLTCIMDAPS
eukprot:scaffold91766_cov69-Phaeocystis_antarctica.AAC.3